MALYPAGKIPQYHFYHKIKRQVGLKLLLVFLKLLLSLIRLGRRLKPSGILYFSLFGVFKFRIKLWLISLGLQIFRLRRKRRVEGKQRRGGKGGGRKKGGRRDGRGEGGF